MIHAITPDRMLALERRFMEETGIPALLLMERAALAVADALRDYDRVLFLCGPGSNGGDGLAAARILILSGCTPIVWQFGDNPFDMVKRQADMLTRAGGMITSIADAIPPLPDVDIIVDALFGIGLTRPLTGIYYTITNMVNASGKDVLAVDIASGLDGSTGQVMGNAIQAGHTVTFHRPKVGHYLYPGRTVTGKLTVAPIGIPVKREIEAADPTILDDDDIHMMLPPRLANTHKGTYGHLLIWAGCMGMAGAAAFCAKAAMKAGAGLAVIASHPSIVPVLQTLVPEATAKAISSIDDLYAALRGKTCIAAGPGLGMDNASLLDALYSPDLRNTPQVWDADALSMLAFSRRPAPPNTIITPHPGEASRLLDCSVAAIMEDPIRAAMRLHRQTGAVVLLKGSTTIITDGTAVSLNISGTPAMAKGGMGDTLTGIIAALLAQGLNTYDAARVGSYIHGRAGARAAAVKGERGVTASDIPDYLWP